MDKVIDRAGTAKVTFYADSTGRQVVEEHRAWWLGAFGRLVAPARP